MQLGEGRFAPFMIYTCILCVFKASAVGMMLRFPIDRQEHAGVAARFRLNT